MEFGPSTNSPPGRKSVTRVSDEGSHPELSIAAAGESGNGDIVGNACDDNERECGGLGVGSQ